MVQQYLNLSKEETNQLIDLRKETVHKIVLEKRNLLDVNARVSIVLDFSGSMDHLYRNGSVQALLDKVFPIAIEFDDNEELDVWIFDHDFKRIGVVNRNNIYGFVKDVYSRYKMGATNYAPVMRDVMQKYLVEEPQNISNYVIFITDGDNNDHSDATKTIIEASKYPIFWQFVGIGNSSYSFLEKLDTMSGRYIDNANFFAVPSAEKFYSDYSEDDVYRDLLNEYPQWLADAKVKEMIANGKNTNQHYNQNDVSNNSGGGFFSKVKRLFG